jgi:hypothetical protein
MVMNSFGREILCSQCEGPSMHIRCLVFFLLSLGGAGGGFFFHFSLVPMCSNYVTAKFSMGSQYVPQAPNLFPNIFSIAPPFYPTCFGKWCPPFTYIGGTKGRNSILQNRTIYFGESPWFHYFEWWTNQIGSLQKNNLNLGGTSSN